MRRSPKFRYRGAVATRAAASSLLETPGDAVIVERGRPRWMVMACPCGCGDEIPINLDPRAGPAWRLYRGRADRISVFPSVWRDTTCGTHFVLWNDRILLFSETDGDSWTEERQEPDTPLLDAVRRFLSSTIPISYIDVAYALDENPWDILAACRFLVRVGFAREGTDKHRSEFTKI